MIMMIILVTSFDFQIHPLQHLLPDFSLCVYLNISTVSKCCSVHLHDLEEVPLFVCFFFSCWENNLVCVALPGEIQVFSHVVKT